MSISRWPFIDLDRFVDEAIRAQNTSLGRSEDQQNSRFLKPRMDLHEDTEKNLVTATFELPGLTKDQVNIDVHNGNLTITGSVSETSEQEEHSYIIRERRSGRFSRTIKLPDATDPKGIKASIENGLLTVTFPKSSPGMEPQRIAIN